MRQRTGLPAILCIEDDRPDRLLVRRVLEAEGYQVLEAENGETGIELARTKRPSLILVDIYMPGMDGCEVATRLKAVDELCSVPVVALTASAMKSDWAKALKAGCVACIQKPIDVDTFPGQLAEILKR